MTFFCSEEFCSEEVQPAWSEWHERKWLVKSEPAESALRGCAHTTRECKDDEGTPLLPQRFVCNDWPAISFCNDSAPTLHLTIEACLAMSLAGCWRCLATHFRSSPTAPAPAPLRLLCAPHGRSCARPILMFIRVTATHLLPALALQKLPAVQGGCIPPQGLPALRRRLALSH
jgi:hypothetical protein